MLGINYESSDEEETSPLTTAPQAQAQSKLPTAAPAPVVEPSVPPGPVNGPAQGPTVSPPPADERPTDDVPPGSPYTSNRLMVQNLTLPPVPNLDIPSSPPGSPPQRATKKFAQFLELKKKGQHFNQRLENSSVLRDPSHLRKLMDFAGISEEDQYASTLPEGVAVPTVWPQWAYGEELNASQKRMSHAKEEEKKSNPNRLVDFVPAAKSSTSSATGTPSGKGSRQSAAERVMSGLDREQSSRSSSQSTSKRKELEHRGVRGDPSSRSRCRSRSRSPKRRRSRSRDRR
ncbi:hypothetical protein BU26DRAFT_515145 [Trematosphaeria pertusa]|uniref:HCNGP-domain-containing protein n=1 Tax=Trematosphaeria pertusa TaxID=390896 RepID=A0A6A6IZV3_9PLEO|nr:uncharacterized protein BU26DRAFT_515145 [Trematosphaeria pertusa]KAF2255432.1 hypothetical protein BU26DRAFT_515145 [Trematosphaeria pertusa]